MGLKYEPSSEPLHVSAQQFHLYHEKYYLERACMKFVRVTGSGSLTVLPSTLNLEPLNPTPSTLHPQPYTLNPTPSTLHPQSYTLNPGPLHLNSSTSGTRRRENLY